MTEGELRASKGALIFIPDGSDRYLRVETSLALQSSFRSGRATMKLVQPASAIAPGPRFDATIEPEHGVPEKVIGDVTGRDGDELVIDAGGLRLCVRPPDDREYSGRVVCQMTGVLEGRDASLAD